MKTPARSEAAAPARRAWTTGKRIATEAMSSLAEYKRAIKHLLGCYATFRRFTPVTLRGEVDWQGFVAIFDLAGHPEAERCYAWPETSGKSSAWRYVAVLHGNGVEDAQGAVRWVARREQADLGRLAQETGLALGALPRFR